MHDKNTHGHAVQHRRDPDAASTRTRKRKREDDGATEFDWFMTARERVASAYVEGNAAPLGNIVARVAPATFFGPQGGCTEGAEKVASKYARDAHAFQPGGESSFEILHAAASDEIAYWVGFQKATARMQGSTEITPMKLRVTEVFRREDGAWKLVHRHADTLAAASSKHGK